MKFIIGVISICNIILGFNWFHNKEPERYSMWRAFDENYDKSKDCAVFNQDGYFAADYCFIKHRVVCEKGRFLLRQFTFYNYRIII